MSMPVLSYFPNKIKAQPTSPGDTNWHYVGIVPTTGVLSFYATLQLLLAAGGGVRPYPGLDAGGKIGTLLIASKTTTGADGDPIDYATDTATLPASYAEAQDTVDGSGQQISEVCPFRNIAIRCHTAIDLLVLNGKH